MKTKKASYFLVFLLILSFATDALAATNTEDTRYFIQTTKGFWKTALGIRHSFEDGFTADLSDWQFRFAKFAGLKVTAVKKFNILPAEAAEVVAQDNNADIEGKPVKPSPSVTPEPTPTPTVPPTPAPVRPVPVEQIPWGVRLLLADPVGTFPSGAASVSVAVLDTGVFRDHEDLKARVTDCKDFSQAKQAIVDGKCEDKNGHGTHVAGIIAADGGADGLGVYGLAPEASIFAYKVCGNNGSCWSDDIATGIRTAVDAGANIINLSLGSDSKSSLIVDAIAYAVSKGVMVVAAAGNDGPYLNSIDYPAASADTVSVAALDSNKTVPDWSSRGINSKTKEYVRNEGDVEFAAPGVNIESTWKDGGYVILSGTSMAAPHVAGLAARVWQFDAENPLQETRELLRALSHDILPPGDDDASGWGLPTIK